MIGLPVVTLDGGSTMAKVEDMIVDPGRRQVLALVIGEKALGRAARAIPFGRISASGPDALVVQNEKVGLDLERDPVLKGLDNGQKVQGVAVMTDDGRKIGTVRDMVIDDRTGEIKSYKVIVGADKREYEIPSDSVVSLGKDILYVSAATAATAGLGDNLATENTDTGSLPARRKATREVVDTTDVASEPEVVSTQTEAGSPVDKLVDGTVAATAGVTNMMGGTTVNMRLLLGIVILVLGILILINPALLPLIAGIALIVIGLWIALQNASGARP